MMGSAPCRFCIEHDGHVAVGIGKMKAGYLRIKRLADSVAS